MRGARGGRGTPDSLEKSAAQDLAENRISRPFKLKLQPPNCPQLQVALQHEVHGQNGLEVAEAEGFALDSLSPINDFRAFYDGRILQERAQK